MASLDEDLMHNLILTHFLFQMREVRTYYKLSNVVNDADYTLAHWNKVMLQEYIPFTNQFYLAGALQAKEYLDQSSFKIQRHKSFRYNATILQRKIKEEAEQLTLHFSRETNEQSSLEIGKAKKKIRKLLKEGASKDQSANLLTAEIQRIFTDKNRAKRIAVTEKARAINYGKMAYMREGGILQKRWKGGPGNCSTCADLDGKEVPINDPFTYLSGQGPYSIVMAPPLHPHCDCTIEPVV